MNTLYKTLLLSLSIVSGLGALAETRLVSTASEGNRGLTPNGASLGAFPDETGSRILFSTSAANLAAGKSGTMNFDVCLMDTTNRTFTLVSTNFDGRSGSGRSIALGVGGGRALFLSDAEDLVEEDANDLTDLFIRDADGTIRRLGRTSPETGANASHTTFGTFSGDGSRVVFEIAADFTSSVEGAYGGIYVAEAASGAVTRIDTIPPYYPSPSTPLVNRDGSVIVYNSNESLSTRSNLVDLVIARSGRSPLRPDLTPGAPSFPSTNYPRIRAKAAVLSLDGRYLAFVADRGPTAGSINVLYWMDLENPGDIRMVQNRVSAENSLSMSPDGRGLAFEVDSVPSLKQVMFWNADSGLGGFDSFLVNIPPASTEPANSRAAVFSPDGLSVLYLTDTRAITASSTNSVTRIALRELRTGITRFLTDLPDGSPANSVGLGEYGFMPEGDAVLIGVPAPLVNGDINDEHDLFLFPTDGSAPDLLTRRGLMLADSSGNNSSQIDEHCLSADGRYLVFASTASDLVPGDTNRSRDIFLKDLQSGTISLVSASTNGGVANSLSTSPRITPDGRFVAFLSTATDLATGDSNRLKDAYLRDLQTGTTTLLSPRVSHLSPRAVTKLEISDDGRTALMESDSTGLVAEDYYSGSQVFLRYVASNTTVRISKNISGVPAFFDSNRARMSADGKTVMFVSQTLPVVYDADSGTAASLLPASGGAANYVAISPDGTRFAMQLSDSNALGEIWLGAFRPFTVRRLVQGLQKPASFISFSPNGNRLIVAVPNGSSTNLAGIFYLSGDPSGVDSGFELVSGTPSGSNGNGSSDHPSMSYDGRFVAFRSTATDLVPGDSGTRFSDVFVRDMVEGRTLSVTGNADERSYRPIISKDGSFVVFNSLASMLTANDYNGLADVFFADVGFPTTLSLQIGREGGSVVIRFPTTTENRYRLERRGSLGSGTWAGDEFFDGDGLERRISLPTGDSSAAFFRVVIQPR